MGVRTETTHNKLVRNKIPEIIAYQKCVPVTRVLSDFEYKNALGEKLMEELAELAEAVTREEMIEELADVMEVIRALSGLEGISLKDILRRRYEKEGEKGNFTDKIFLEKVVHDTDWDAI